MKLPKYKFHFTDTNNIYALFRNPPDKYPTLEHLDTFKNNLGFWCTLKDKIEKLDKLLADFALKEKRIKIYKGTIKILEVSDNSNDIKPYLSLISSINEINSDDVELLNDIWIDLGKMRDRITFILDEKWVNSNKIKCPYENLISNLAKWEESHKTNFKSIFTILEKFYLFGNNYIPVIYMIIKNLNDLYEIISDIEKSLICDIKYLNRSMDYQDKLTDKYSIFDLAKEYEFDDFSMFDDIINRSCLQSMSKAISKINGSIEWLKTDGRIGNSKILFDILKQPEIIECGHSKGSLNWTLSQFRCIYSKGWNRWVIMTLLIRGIGWNQLNLRQAFKYGNEKCCIFCLKLYQQKIDNIYIDKAIKRKWSQLIEYILSVYGMIFSKEDYIKWTYLCEDTKLLKAFELFKNTWEKYYPRKIYYGDIKYENVIREIWKAIAVHDNHDISILPTDQEIANFAFGKQLCGIDLNLNLNKTECDPYNFDKKFYDGSFEDIIYNLRVKSLK